MSQLLSLENTSVNSEIISLDSVPSDNIIDIATTFTYGATTSNVTMVIPNDNAYVIEHKMLGEMDSIKSSVDDDMLDALKEIGANITGAIANSINAQGDSVITGVKFNVEGVEAQNSLDTTGYESILKVNITSDGTNLEFYFLLDNSVNELISGLSDDIVPVETKRNDICDNNLDNLELLMDVELEVSVRIGSKIMLLKDIVKLDLGDVIELDQLVNNPLDILVNGVKIADGEAVVVGGNFAVKIKTMGSKKDRLSSLRIAS